MHHVVVVVPTSYDDLRSAFPCIPLLQAMAEQDGLKADGATFAAGVKFAATEGHLAEMVEDNPKVKELVGARCGHFALAGDLTLPQVCM